MKEHFLAASTLVIINFSLGENVSKNVIKNVWEH